MDLSTDALLVNPKIKMRGLTAKSDKLTNEATEQHDAESGTYSSTVRKFSQETLAPIIAIRNAAKIFHTENTLPWGGQGIRLIPVTRYKHWERTLNEMRDSYFDAVGELVKDYAGLRKAYIKAATAEVAAEIPFPTLEQLRSNFDFQLFMQSIANPSDLRLQHVNAKVVAELKRTITDSTNAILDEGHNEIVKRLYKVVARLHEQTSDPDKRLFESLITNIQETVDVLPSLNLRNDPEINRLISAAKKNLANIDVVALRINPKKMDRKQIAVLNAERSKINKVAGDVLSDIQGYSGKRRSKPVVVTTPTIVAVKTVPTIGAKSSRSAFANVTI